MTPRHSNRPKEERTEEEQAAHQAYHKAYAQRPKSKMRRRFSALKRRYGVSAQELQRRWVDQAGLCACCGSSLQSPTRLQNPTGRRSDRPQVDHCHDTGAVRGLLCNACNRGIGMLQDNAAICRRAAEYLED